MNIQTILTFPDKTSNLTTQTKPLVSSSLRDSFPNQALLYRIIPILVLLGVGLYPRFGNKLLELSRVETF